MASPAIVTPVNEVVDSFAQAPSRDDIAAFRLSPAAREYLRELLARNAVGTLAAKEQHELDQIVLLDDIISLIRACVHDTTMSPA